MVAFLIDAFKKNLFEFVLIMTDSEIEIQIVALNEQLCFEQMEFMRAVNNSPKISNLWYESLRSTIMEIHVLVNELKLRNKQ